MLLFRSRHRHHTHKKENKRHLCPSTAPGVLRARRNAEDVKKPQQASRELFSFSGGKPTQPVVLHLRLKRTSSPWCSSRSEYVKKHRTELHKSVSLCRSGFYKCRAPKGEKRKKKAAGIGGVSVMPRIARKEEEGGGGGGKVEHAAWRQHRQEENKRKQD